MNRYLTPPDVARELGIGMHKVTAWIRSGELRAANVATQRIGRPRWRIDRADLTLFLTARSNTTPPATRRRRQTAPGEVIEFF